MSLAVAVLGAGGRVGRMLVELIERDSELDLAAAVGRGQIGPECFGNAAVVIDFSLPDGLSQALPHLGDAALVSGTTGLDDGLHFALSKRSRTHAVLRADNFSTGVTVLAELVATAARSLPDYDIEIVEAHHRRKVDAPSGTALFLAKRAAAAREQSLSDSAVHGRQGAVGPRSAGEIGIHALRGGDIVGEHTVWLSGDGDRLKLGHVATSREAFARGAIRAARFIGSREPGMYTMVDVLGL